VEEEERENRRASSNRLFYGPCEREAEGGTRKGARKKEGNPPPTYRPSPLLGEKSGSTATKEIWRGHAHTGKLKNQQLIMMRDNEWFL